MITPFDNTEKFFHSIFSKYYCANVEFFNQKQENLEKIQIS